RGLKFFYHSSSAAQSGALTRFSERFAARYNSQEIPLLEALDEESGIGFEGGVQTSPLLRGLAFGMSREPGENRLAELVLEKLNSVFQSNESELVLSENDWERIVSAKTRLSLPDSLSIQAVLAAHGREALARGEFQLLWQGAFGPS